MEFGNRLLTQIKALWEQWSFAQRAGMVAALLASVIAFAAIGLWATTPEYVFLTDRLSPQQAAEIVSLLEAEQIPYKLNYSGSAVSVARSQLSRARLALKDVVTDADTPTEEISDGIWTDPAMQQVRLVRQLESRLARSIMQIASVRKATVHLTQSENTPFLRNRAPAKASVILELQPNAHFSGSDARSIISLVAHSVEHLNSENISVLDTSGRLLSTTTGMEADVSGQLSYRARVEADLAAKAETILTQMLGPGKAVVRVTADVDFTELQRKETKYDPDLKVKVSETIHSESHSHGNGKNTPLPAGASGNIDPLAFKAAASGSSGGTKVESNTTTFENAKTEDTVREAPGRVKRLTVAAVVQLPDSTPATGGQAGASALNEEKIQRIIKQAVGYDAARQDQIEVLIAPLSGTGEILPPVATGTNWDQYSQLLRSLSLGLAAIVALVLGLLVLRRMQPIVVAPPESEQLSSETVLRLAELKTQAREHPAAVATVFKAWLEQAPPEQVRQRSAA
ncbi:flagellar basal-body MS-ring/collar protein FliF [Planctomicrobium sp. SH664]|uniref:flagellar basal-body MS-ring/collar protein FliF n=1 Tax=Planctomicrobium sp. SH664 TaxID=3448125 RepID=UPI003F5B1BA5